MNNSSPINDQADAIRWLLENRRPEVTPEKALRILRLVLHDDPAAQQTLDALAQEIAA